MNTFRYTATDDMGHQVSGTVAAESPSAVQDALAERGYKVVHVDQTGSFRAPSVGRSMGGRLSVYALAPFFRQFAVLYRAAVPMQSAFETLEKQTQNSRLRAVLRQMQMDVLSGMGLSKSMARHAPAFSRLEMSMIRAGEEGGFLEKSLFYVADYLDQEIELRRLLRSVLFWPVLVLVFAIMIPPLTNFIIHSMTGKSGLGVGGGFLNDTQLWLVSVVSLVFLVVAFRVAMQSAAFRLGWDHVRIRIPFIGKTVHMLMMARFGRALGALYRGGVPFSSALVLAADATGSELIRERVYVAARKIEEGSSVASALEQSGVFNPMVLAMVRTGENTGEVDQMLENVAEFSEEEAKVRTKQAGMVFGVGVFLLVAAYVLVIVLQFYGGYAANIMRYGQ